MTEQLTLIEAINEFYRLKNKYESSYYEKYVKPIIKSNRSKREKRSDYSKLPKHECVNCKRNVGTTFSIQNDIEKKVKRYIAKCGDTQDPCPLDIQISYANRNTFETLIDEFLKSIELTKLQIIKEKNNALFFNKDVVGIFEKLTQDLKADTDDGGMLIESNLLRNDNPEKKDLLKLTIDEFGKGFILPFKQMVKEYSETNNELILNQAIQFYINEMIPKLKEIQKLRFDVSYVEYDQDENIYKLIQIPNSLESKEFYWKQDDKIDTFIRGVRKDKTKTRKERTTRNTSTDANRRNVSKNITRKIKPVDNIVIEEEVEEDNKVPTQMRLANKYQDIPVISPVTTENGLTWNNREYDLLWTMIPDMLKEEFDINPEWRDEFMHSCANDRKNKVDGCQLTTPPNLKMPPALENGKYDFGVNIYNKVFNAQSKEMQETILSSYSENPTTKEKDYSKGISILNRLVEEEITRDWDIMLFG